MRYPFEALGAPAAGLYRLPATRVAVHGPDAAPFLDRLATQRMRAMAVGDAGRVFFLDARGRTQVAAYASRTAEAHFALDCPDPAAAEALRALLDQYHFGEALEFSVAPLTCLGLHGPQAEAVFAAAALSDVASVPRPRLGQPGRDLWVEADQVEAVIAALTAAGAQPASLEVFDRARVAAGQPAWPSEYTADTTPLDVGPDGIADQKGCYPGQEVIERTVAIGRPARRLATAQLSGPAHAGDALEADGAAVGRLTSVATLPDGSWLALALVKSRFGGAQAQTSDGVTAHLSPPETP